MRFARLAIVVLSSWLILAAPAAAKKRALHCKRGYVAKTVKQHKRGHVVKVAKCVKKRATHSPVAHSVPGPSIPTSEPTPAPTPAPVTASEPKPSLKLEILMRFWDPINVEEPEFNKAKSGYRFVAVELSLTNVSSETVSSDANWDTTVIGTNSQSYTATFAERKGCTDFGGVLGPFTLAPGAHEIGCIVYELPEGVKIAKAQWNDNLPGEESTRTF